MRQRANRHGEPSQNVPENCLTVNLTNTDKPDQQDGFVSKDSCQPNSLRVRFLEPTQWKIQLPEVL